MQFVVTAADKEKVQFLTFSSVTSQREMLFLRASPDLFMTCLIAPPTVVLLVMSNEHLLAAWEALLAFTTGRQLEVSCIAGSPLFREK